MKPFKPLVTDGQERHLRVAERLYNILRNGVSFGDGISPDNIDCCFITAVFTVANADLTINHTLGRVPIGYIPFNKVAACDVYTGGVAATASQITLRGTVTTTVKLMLF